MRRDDGLTVRDKVVVGGGVEPPPVPPPPQPVKTAAIKKTSQSGSAGSSFRSKPMEALSKEMIFADSVA
jgi:hypothetical protein